MATAVVQQERKLVFIPVNSIRESAEALRTVDRKNAEYILLADSIRQNGVLNPISVREMQDSETGESFYSLVDGCQRWNASKDAGMETVPAQVISSSDIEVLMQQIIGNTGRVETLPAEHSKQLQRILQINPTMTSAELASKLSRGEPWLKDRLKLTNLTPEAAKLVDSGAINLMNAYVLAKLPQDEQSNYLQQAQEMSTSEFGNLGKGRLEAIAKAKRAGGTADSNTVFTHKPYLLKVGDIVTESQTGAVGAQVIAEGRLTTAEEGWKAALLWASTSDEKSVAAAKAKWDQQQADLAAKKEKAKLERERRKAGAAEIKSQRAKLELSLAEANASPEEVAAKLAEFDAAHKPKEEATTVADAS